MMSSHTISHDFSVRSVVVRALSAIILSVVAAAQTTTYSYTGPLFTVLSSPLSCPSICNLNGSFVTAQPIAPNQSAITVAPQSFSFTDGYSTVTNLNTFDASFTISTDSQGQIVGWAIFVFGPTSGLSIGETKLTVVELSTYAQTTGDYTQYYQDLGGNVLAYAEDAGESPGTWKRTSGGIHVTLTADNTGPLPSILLTGANQPSVINLTVKLTGAPDGQVDFSVAATNLESRAGHNHTDTTGLLLGAFGSNTLVTNPSTTCMTQAGTCNVKFTVSEVSGSYNLRARLDADPTKSGTLPILVGIPSLSPLQSSKYYVQDGSFGQPGVTSEHKLNHYGTPALNSNVNTVAQMYFNSSSTSGQRLGINDMSLPLGGLFDIKNRWTKPHQLHRQGDSVDIDHRSYKGTTRPPLNNQLLSGLMKTAGMIQAASDPNIHYQIGGTHASPLVTPPLSDVPGVVGARVSATVSRAGRLFTYSYAAMNHIASRANIADLELDVSTSSGGASLSNEDIVQADGSLVAYENEILSCKTSVPTVPVGLSAPLGWVGTVSTDGSVNWIAETEKDSIWPGGSAGLFQISSPGLPGVRRYLARPYIDLNSLNLVQLSDGEDFIHYQTQFDAIEGAASSGGYTVGPVPPPAKFDGLQFLKIIHEYKNTAEKLGWIHDPNLADVLEASFIRAESHLLNENATESVQVMQSILAALDKSSEGLDPEADVLLRFNVEYLIQSLP